MVAINEKVIYHVKVWVLEEILCNALGSASLCNQRFLFNPKKEITTVQKVILSNEYKFIYMFGDEFLVQYKGLLTSGMCFFFPRKTCDENEQIKCHVSSFCHQLRTFSIILVSF